MRVVDESFEIVVGTAVATGPTIGRLDGKKRDGRVTDVIVAVEFIDRQQLNRVDAQRLDVIEFLPELRKISLFSRSPGKVTIVACLIPPIFVAAADVCSLKDLVNDHLPAPRRAMPTVRPLESGCIFVDGAGLAVVHRTRVGINAVAGIAILNHDLEPITITIIQNRRARGHLPITRQHLAAVSDCGRREQDRRHKRLLIPAHEFDTARVRSPNLYFIHISRPGNANSLLFSLCMFNFRVVARQLPKCQQAL